MGILFTSAADGGNVTSASSLTFPYTVGAGSNRMLYALVDGDAVRDLITGVTYDAVPMTLIDKQLPTGNRWQYAFFSLNPPPGGHNVVVSASGNCDFILAGVDDYTGVKQSGQPDAFTKQISGMAPTSLTTSLTTVADNCWFVLAEQGFNADLSPPGAGAGATRRTFDAAFGTWGLFDSGGDLTPAGSHSITTTRVGSSSARIGHILASFAPDTGGDTFGGGQPLLHMRGSDAFQTRTRGLPSYRPQTEPWLYPWRGRKGWTPGLANWSWNSLRVANHNLLTLRENCRASPRSHSQPRLLPQMRSIRV